MRHANAIANSKIQSIHASGLACAVGSDWAGQNGGRPGSGWYDLNPGGKRLPDDPQESWVEALTICLNYEWQILDIDRLTTG